MIRYRFIEKQVLNVYKQLDTINFPINIKEVISLKKDVALITYHEIAKLNNCSINDVISVCQSKSGCTHYDVESKRYLIAYNKISNNAGRQLWTIAHELGHIYCNHFKILSFSHFSEDIGYVERSDYEKEADYFAALLLAPFPLYKMFNINSPKDVQTVFGLSAEASLYRYNHYQEWIKNRVKTSWENDVMREYICKNIFV